MNKKKTLIIIIIAAVVLVAALLLLIFLPKGGGESDNAAASLDEGTAMTLTTDENGMHQATVLTKNGEIENNSYGTLLEYVPADLKEIHVENAKGTLDILAETPENETTQYTIKGLEDFDMQSGVPAEIGSAAAALDFSKVISLDGSKAAEFGLDKPRATVTVQYNDGTSARITVGDDAPQAAGTYIRFGTADTVYLTDSEVVAAFDKGINDLISLTINSSATESDDNRVSEITISGAAFPETVSLAAYDGEKASFSFRVTAPFEGYANELESSLVEGGIRGLYATSVDLVNPSQAQLKSAGLDKPYAKIKAVYPDCTISLLAAKPQGDSVQLMEDGGRIVYSVPADKVPWVTTSAEKLVNEYVLYPKLVALSEMKVTSGGKTYDFALSSKTSTTTDDDGNETTATVTTVLRDGEEIQLESFSPFYDNAAMIELADTDKAQPNGSPALTLEYTYVTDGTTDKVEIYAVSDGKYIACLNGKVVGRVRKSEITRVQNSLEQLNANT